ncbi:MAG: cysteine dioxygenase family protein [Cyanobacteria bacterium]|nr:cysteine dioxygenase family protein [Cyanobacteriota bacterium]
MTELVDRLNRAMDVGAPEAITLRVKDELEDLLGRQTLDLPTRFRVPRQEGYARRLLYRDPDNRYTVIVMTWAPGQATPVHDHGGLWCVEGVVEGQMQVTQYDVHSLGDRFEVTPLSAPIAADVGSAGRLIPPVDYHVLANAQPDATSITLHVYGGELDSCRIYTQGPDGCYKESIRALSYHD